MTLDQLSRGTLPGPSMLSLSAAMLPLLSTTSWHSLLWLSLWAQSLGFKAVIMTSMMGIMVDATILVVMMIMETTTVISRYAITERTKP